MNDRVKVVAGISGLLLLSGATAFLIREMDTLGGISAPSETETYINESYGYSFAYDKDLSVVELSDEYVDIEEVADEPNEVVSVAVLTSDAPERTDFSAFVHERASIFCAADRPSGSTSCPKVARSQPFTTATGIQGEIFYLVLSHTTNEGTSTREAGPFYAFDISRSAGDERFVALTLRPARFLEESDTYDLGAKVANDVVNTLRIERR